MVRVLRKKEQVNSLLGSNVVIENKPCKYEHKYSPKQKKLPKTPTIKTYLHVVECVNTPKDFNKIISNQFNDNVCSEVSKATCIDNFYHNEIITDQAYQITDTTPVTPHRIKLEAETNIKNTESLTTKSKARKKCILNGNVVESRTSTITEYFPVRRSNRKTKTVVLEEKKQNLEDAIKSKVEQGLEIRYFDNKGRGIIATQKFQRGDFVVEYRGELIDDNEAKRRELTYARDQNAGCYMYYFKHKNRQYCVDATPESKYFGRLVNHSRNGNLVTRIEEIDGKPHLVLIAKDDIEIGEEITYDYGDRSKESLKHHPWLAY